MKRDEIKRARERASGKEKRGKDGDMDGDWPFPLNERSGEQSAQ